MEVWPYVENIQLCRYLPRYFAVVRLGMLLEDFEPNVLIPMLRELGSINRFLLRFSTQLEFERPCLAGIHSSDGFS